MIKKMICSMLVASCLLQAVVYANEITNKPGTDSKPINDGVMTINGQLNEKIANALVNMFIYDKDDNCIYLKQQKTDSEGKYVFTLNLNDIIDIDEGGNFVVKTASQKEGVDFMNFKYYRKEAFETIVNDLRLIQENENKTTEEKVHEITSELKNAKEMLSNYNEGFETLSDDDCGRIAELIFDESITIDNLSAVINRAYGILMIEKATVSDNVKALVETYADVIMLNTEVPEYGQFETAEKYAAVKEDIKNRVYANLAKSTVTYNSKEAFYADVYNCAAIAELYTFKGTEGLRASIIRYDKTPALERAVVNVKMGYDLSKFNATPATQITKLNNIATACEAKTINTVDDVQTYLDATVVVQQNPSGGSNSGSGGSGGSGGGSSSGIGIGFGGNSDYNPANTVTSPKREFQDLKGYEWAEESIYKLVALNVVDGYSETVFGPANNISRAEFCKLLQLAMGIKDSFSAVEFVDISEKDWYYSYVCSLASAGIVSGVGEGKFNPNGNITRQDMAVMICRALESKGVVLDATEVIFNDSDNIAEYATEAVHKLYNAELMTGKGNGSFEPIEYTTRAEAAKAICNMYEYADMKADN